MNCFPSAVSSCRLSRNPIPVALASVCLFCANGQLLQLLGKTRTISHLFNLCLCHLGGLLFFPYVHVSDLRNLAFIRNAVGFSFLLMLYNWCWLCAADFLLVGTVNAIFQFNVALCGVYEAYFRDSRTGGGQKARKRVKIAGIVLCMVGTTIAGLSAASDDVTNVVDLEADTVGTSGSRRIAWDKTRGTPPQELT